MATPYKIIAALLTALLMTACSGGGGGGNASNAPGSTASSSGSQSSVTPVTPPSSGGGSESSTTPPPATTPAPGATSHSLQLSWAIPTTRENGTALTISELAGYQVYYYLDGTSAGAGNVVNINGGTTSSTQISLTGSGTYYFAIAARDQAGLLSNLSNYVAVTLN